MSPECSVDYRKRCTVQRLQHQFYARVAQEPTCHTARCLQMVACVGQQSVGGKRATNGFKDRTLPHYPRGDRTPAGEWVRE
jgi:hypothetical protein